MGAQITLSNKSFDVFLIKLCIRSQLKNKQKSMNSEIVLSYQCLSYFSSPLALKAHGLGVYLTVSWATNAQITSAMAVSEKMFDH